MKLNLYTILPRPTIAYHPETKSYRIQRYALILSQLSILSALSRSSCPSSTILNERSDSVCFGSDFYVFFFIERGSFFKFGSSRRKSKCKGKDGLPEDRAYCKRTKLRRRIQMYHSGSNLLSGGRTFFELFCKSESRLESESAENKLRACPKTVLRDILR